MIAAMWVVAFVGVACLILAVVNADLGAGLMGVLLLVVAGVVGTVVDARRRATELEKETE